jgi:hypothetical protein
MMQHLKHALLVFCALYELARYDVVSAWRGSTNMRWLNPRSITNKPTSHELVRITCDAVSFATCLYWKPVLCLQRSVCIVRLLRKRGVGARLVIGYRPAPFFFHAWVEVSGRIVNDSAAYQQRLQLLYST